jgi:hypothetical protein
MSGINYEQRQIFSAPVQFSDRTGIKPRPVIIISNNKHNQTNNDLICCPITSKNNYFGRIICPQDYEVKENTLPIAQSEVKSQLPFFIHKSLLILPKSGRIKLKKEFMDKIIQDIKDIIEKR